MGAARGRRPAVSAVPDTGDSPPPVSVNLDTLEREDAPARPFAPVVGGRQYVLNDIQEVPWDALVAAESNALEFLRMVVPKPDHDAFFAALGQLPAWKVRQLVTLYMANYGQPAPGEGPA